MQAIPREILSNNWMTFIVLFALVLLFLMKVFKADRLLGYSVSFFSTGYFEKRAEENESFFSSFYILLSVFSVLILALYITLLAPAFLPYFQLNFISFLKIVIAVSLYVSARFFIDFLLAKTLLINGLTKYYRYTKFGYLHNVCLWLFPLLIIYIYGWQNKMFLLISFSVLALMRLGLILFNNKKLIVNHFFYFILYICALEIAPLLIIYKLIQ